ncbi:MAG: TonB-dependent receptor [bacterium]|nr:MAG: TonB-dependent receptor [bacterium]
MTKFLKISICWGIVISLNYNIRLYAYSEVAGIQSGVWSLNNSPYVVKSDILIPKGLILKIEEGVVVKFAGNYRIIVSGGLIAKGKKTNPIIFTSVFDNEFGKIAFKQIRIPKLSEWKGIEFSDDCDDYLTILDHCIVRYSQWGIRCSNSYPLLTNLMLIHNENRFLQINNLDYPFEPGEIINPISHETRPSISPLPEPIQETDLERVKRIMERQRLKIEQQRLKALQDSIRKVNKIEPIFSKTGRITIEREIFDQFNVQSINELIGYFPGFLNFATIWTGSQMTSRGITPTLSNNRLLFLINGVPFYEPVAKTSYLEFIPLDAIEKIEVDRGIKPSRFNHHGVIGSVNFLPRYCASGLVNKSKIELGGFGTKKLTTFLGFQHDSTFINLSMNFLNNPGYWKTLSQGEMGLDFRQKYASDRYNFFMFVKHSSMSVFTSYFEHDQFQLGLVPQLQYTGPTQRRGLVFSLSKEIKINPQISTKIVGNCVKNYERSELATPGSVGYQLSSDENYIRSQGNLISIAVLSQYRQPRYLAMAGITVSRFMVESLFEVNNREDGFTQNENWRIPSEVLNYENLGFVEIGYNLSPFIGFNGKTYISFANLSSQPDFSMDARIIYKPFLPFDTYLRYTRAMRTATSIEKSIYLPDLFYGTTELKNEKFEQWEWSTDFHIKRDLTFGFIVYHVKSTNLIQLNPDYYFTNSDTIFRTTGFESLLQGKINNKIFLLTNVARNHRKYSGWFYPKFKINGLAKIHWLGNFSTITTFQYLGQLSSINKLGPYYLVHLSLVYQLLHKIQISLNGFDLLNQCPENPEYIRGEIPTIPIGPGRSFYLTMKIE